MLIRTLMSCATGALVWIFASAIGLQLATEWGVIAFVLNYIPFIGPVHRDAFPTLFAHDAVRRRGSRSSSSLLASTSSSSSSVALIEPRSSSNALAMSPFVVLFAIFLWAFMWGVFGAFIGVPIAIAVLTFCAHHPAALAACNSSRTADRARSRIGAMRARPHAAQKRQMSGTMKTATMKNQISSGRPSFQ